MPLDTIRFGAHKMPRESYLEFGAMRSRNLDMLARCLNLHTTVAVVGAGCSIPRGYVSWTRFAQRLLQHTATTLQTGSNRLRLRGQIETMANFLQAALEPNAEGVARGIDNSSLMYFIGACKQAILGAESYEKASKDAQIAFKNIFYDLFHDGENPDPDLNPYEILLNLPIWRFVTTNYDQEIERTILAQGDRYTSLTQEDDNTNELTRFALTDIPKKRRFSVFHCHGRFDEPKSIIAGEADYQRWYLGQHRKTGSAFRQSIELLFESNPLLFVGYSLGDEDLLRPLRVLGALDPERKPSRPIFALMPSKGEEDTYRLQQYYERYGLQVISYDQPSATENLDGREHTRRFCLALEEIHEHWLEAQKEWHVKPPPRKVTACRFKEEGKAPINWRWDQAIQVPVSTRQAEFRQLRAELSSPKRPAVMGFIGPSGCGKTRQVRGLMEELRQLGTPPDGPFESYFYWNAHYINEGMTGIDQLLDFLEAGGGTEIPRFQRLADALAGRNSLVIIDGAERLLQPTDQPLIGIPINGYVRQLLQIFAKPGNQTTIVLVGRLWPKSFHQAAEGAPPTSCSRVDASRIHREDMEHFLHEIGQENLLRDGSGKAEGRLSALVSLLSGHSYGLLLALDFVREELHQDPTARSEQKIDGIFGEVQRQLAKSRIDGRLTAIIRLALRQLDGQTQCLASKFLRYLAFSLNALSTRALVTMHQEAKADVEAIQKKKAELKQENGLTKAAPPVGPEPLPLPSFEDLLQLLSRRHMVVPMPRVHETSASEDRSENAETYAVHSKIRGFFHARAGLPVDLLPSLTLSGVSSGGHGVDPGTKDGPKAEALLAKLLDQGELELIASQEAAKAGNLESKAAHRRIACDLCRDAFSIMRARMEANTSPRWNRYSSYVTLGIRIAQLAKAIAEDHQVWDHRDTQDRTELENWHGALFLGEMAWLYNDVGLALYGEGLMADAYAVWEQAFDISRMIEEDEIYGGSYQIQSLLNLSYAFLDLGRPSSAKEYLTRAEGMNRSLGDPGLGARIRGFQGLIHHLSGNLKEAEVCYDQALETLKDLRVDLRALSFFHKYRGDLRLASNRVDLAEEDIRAAMILAEESRYPDLTIEAQMSMGRIRARREKWSEARLLYKAALRATRRIHCRRLEAAVLCNLARLALDQGDSGSAKYHALQSLKLANELQLGLRVSHSLVVLGLATLDAGQRELGVSYLRQAKLLAEQQQYWFRAQEAEMKLQELGEEDPQSY